MGGRWLTGLALLALLVSGCARVPMPPPYLWSGDRPVVAQRGDPGWLVARRENLDPELREWVDRSLLIPSSQVLVRGDWTYVLVTWTPDQDLRPHVTGVVREDGEVVALVDFIPAGDGDQDYYSLAVIRHGGSQVDVRHAGGTWLIPRLNDPSLARLPAARSEGLHLFEPAAGDQVGPLVRVTGLARTRVTYQLVRGGGDAGNEDVIAEGVALDRAEPWQWTPFAIDVPVPLPGYSPEMDDAPLFSLVLRVRAHGAGVDVPIMARGAIRVLAHPAPVMCRDAAYLAYGLPGDGEARHLGVWVAGGAWIEEPVFTLPPGETLVGPMAFNPTSPLLALVAAARDGWRLYLLDHRSGEAVLLDHLDTAPSGMVWSLDGRYLFWHPPAVWYDMAARQGHDLTPLLTGDDDHDGTEGLARAFLLSSFGIRVAYSLYQDGEEDLWILDLHVRSRERVTHGDMGGYPEAWLTNDAALVFTAGALHGEWERGLWITAAGEVEELLPHGRGQNFHLVGADPSGRYLVAGSRGPEKEAAVLLLDLTDGVTWQLLEDGIPVQALFHGESDAQMALVHVRDGPADQLWHLDLHGMSAHMVLERDRPLDVLAVASPHAYFTERAPGDPVDAVSIGRINLLTGHLRWFR